MLVVLRMTEGSLRNFVGFGQVRHPGFTSTVQGVADTVVRCWPNGTKT